MYCNSHVQASHFISSVRWQKGLTSYCFKYVDRLSCLQTDDLVWFLTHNKMLAMCLLQLVTHTQMTLNFHNFWHLNIQWKWLPIHLNDQFAKSCRHTRQLYSDSMFNVYDTHSEWCTSGQFWLFLPQNSKQCLLWWMHMVYCTKHCM